MVGTYLPHTLIAFGGSLSSNDDNNVDEIWECTLRVVNQSGAGEIGDPLSWANAAAPYLAHGLITANFTNLGQSGGPITNGMLVDYAQVEYVKCNNIGADGRYASNVSNTVFLVTPLKGTKPALHASIMTLCMSWRSDRARGIGANGRMFLPNAGMGLAHSMYVSGAEAASVVGFAQEMIKNFKNGFGGIAEPVIPVIASKGSKKSGYTDGVCAPITSVRVGQVYDVQRRRKNALVEIYNAGVIAA